MECPGPPGDGESARKELMKELKKEEKVSSQNMSSGQKDMSAKMESNESRREHALALYPTPFDEIPAPELLSSENVQLLSREYTHNVRFLHNFYVFALETAVSNGKSPAEPPVAPTQSHRLSYGVSELNVQARVTEMGRIMDIAAGTVRAPNCPDLLTLYLHEPPRYPQHSGILSRLDTFEAKELGDYQLFSSSWPHEHSEGLSAHTLASAGFFYSGEDMATDYSVACWCCGVEIEGWAPGLEAAAEHANRSPVCSFLLLTKGREFVAKSLLKAKLDADVGLAVQIYPPFFEGILQKEKEILFTGFLFIIPFGLASHTELPHNNSTD